MAENFTREQRYFVFKLSDAQAFAPGYMTALVDVERLIALGRRYNGQPQFDAVVVEQDWPEFEPTWASIEARVAGAKPAAQEAVDARFVPLPSGKYVVMGDGNFAVGGCVCTVSGLDGIVYVPLPKPRPVGSDTTDLFPVGSVQAEAAAVIYFKTDAAIVQTIDVLHEVLAQRRARDAANHES